MADAIETMEGVFCEIGRGDAKVFPVVMGHGPKQGTLLQHEKADC